MHPCALSTYVQELLDGCDVILADSSLQLLKLGAHVKDGRVIAALPSVTKAWVSYLASSLATLATNETNLGLFTMSFPRQKVS